VADWIPSALLFSPLTVALTAWEAWVLLKVWQWYMPSEIAAARFSVAFGVVLIARLLTLQPYSGPASTALKEAALRLGIVNGAADAPPDPLKEMALGLADRLLLPVTILVASWVGSFLFGQP
jgi:hypothetical protein